MYDQFMIHKAVRSFADEWRLWIRVTETDLKIDEDLDDDPEIHSQIYMIEKS